MSDKSNEVPDWYDESKLRKAYYDQGYSGWVIDLGDGTCRYANSPLLGEDGPKWGDRVNLVRCNDGTLMAVPSPILERYER